MEFIEQKKREVEQWVRRQPPHVEVAAATASGAAQGALIGGLMATFSSMEPPPVAGGMPPPPKVRQASLPLPRACLIAPISAAHLQPPGMVGGPAVLARNFAVMTGVNAGLQAAIKKARGGVEDVQGRCVRRPAAARKRHEPTPGDSRASPTQHGRLFWRRRSLLVS